MYLLSQWVCKFNDGWPLGYAIYQLLGYLCLQIHIVHNVNNDKPRGYAFIEYEHERDMHGMYPKIFMSKN